MFYDYERLEETNLEPCIIFIDKGKMHDAN